MAAVEVRNGYKFYGSASDPNKKIVLNYLNMNVMRGSIYGLLGASGCGKTTLLSCIVGQRKLISGEINVLGLKPGTPGSGIPGPLVGYMPQEIALVEEMTVKETIFYFGRIYGLNDERVHDRYRLLKDLLELPPARRLVGNLSGGQQRRVSFACAMIHEPELLILDEPTVGLDPILREKIWSFLVDTTKNSKLAVIITTHYIEEAKQANCIGLMRNGILLAEDTPDNVMIKYECASIEDAFLILCQRQGNSDEAQANLQKLNDITQDQSNNHIFKEDTGIFDKSKSLLKRSLSIQEKKTHNTKKRILFTTKCRMKALLAKNMLQMIRNPSGVLFMLIFPILQLSCFYLAIGKNPEDLNLGIVNREVPDYNMCANSSLITATKVEDSCYFNKISCRYIAEIDTKMCKKIFFDTIEEAYDAAKRAETIGFIYFSGNFSSGIQILLDEGTSTDEDRIEDGKIVVHLDMSDQQIGYFVERRLRDAYKNFVENLMKDCDFPTNLANIPVVFHDAIFGSIDDEYRRYAAPGVIMTMIFFLAALITSAVFITERMGGIWDRTLVAGISTSEMLIAHIISQSSIMTLQCLEVIVFVATVFDTENRGSNLTIITLLVLTGFSGMLFGLLISVYCHTHTMANFVATGAFYPMIMLCGLLWPLEGMPNLLRKFALIFPFTVPVVSVRNVLEKGWSIQNSQVYNGFLMMLLWIALLFAFCIIGLKRKS